MSGKAPLRHDKTCLNCGQEVPERFCTHCGQENTDTRKTFHHLFIHFFEDLTHYENAFWKTIHHLIFKPGRLTREYLSGKRLSYLAPVRLYIFISFITFFLVTILPSNDDSDAIQIGHKQHAVAHTHMQGPAKDSAQAVADSLLKKREAISRLVREGVLSKKQGDTLSYMLVSKKEPNDGNILEANCTTLQQLDSVQKNSKPADRYSDWQYWLYKKYIKVTHGNTREQLWDKWKESFVHNFPKILFIYMPLFAFFLWLFHGKKRWYYFDHGIFTLHYFSFLLVMYLIVILADSLLSYLGTFGTIVSAFFSVACALWTFYYFFPAHHRFYGESLIISLLKSLLLLFINFFLIIFLLLAFAAWTLLNLH
jgi:hypothetical protein